MNVRTVNYKGADSPHNFTKSLHQTGFAVLNHHPIDKSLVQKVYSEWSLFFANNIGQNYIFNSEKQDGYFPFGIENAKGVAANDLKEFYHFYPWGKYPNELSDATKILYKKLVELTSILLGWIQNETPDSVTLNFSMKLPEMIIDSKSHLLRIIHYPPLNGTENPEAIRAAAHEDINLITLLLAGSQPGLQVKDLSGNWHDIPCDAGSLAINTGDMLQEISEGYFPSTTHRVINPGNNITNESRYSMPLFLHPRDEVILSEHYTAREYLDERLIEIGLKK